MTEQEFEERQDFEKHFYDDEKLDALMSDEPNDFDESFDEDVEEDFIHQDLDN